MHPDINIKKCPLFICSHIIFCQRYTDSCRHALAHPKDLSCSATNCENVRRIHSDLDGSIVCVQIEETKEDD